jgi:hypothetical protein
MTIKMTIARALFGKRLAHFIQQKKNSKAQANFASDTTHALSSNFLFIVGCGHSGTSVLNKIIGVHPNVFPVGGESELFLNFNGDAREISNQISNWVEQARINEASMVLEKTPLHIHKIQLIRKFLPNARFVFITRNPLDCIASLHKRYDDLEAAISRYHMDNFEGLLISRFSFVHRVKYEHLITDFQKTIRTILEFAELHEEDLSNFHEQKTYYDHNTIVKTERYSSENHSAVRNFQVNQPVYDTRGVSASSLTEQETGHIKSEARFISTLLGYNLQTR